MLYLVALLGLCVVGTATHANVMHSGGYGSDHAPQIIAVAAFIPFGMYAVGYAWGAGRKAIAIVLSICLLAGEGYWLLTNAEREIVARERQAAPSVDHARLYKLAEQRVEDAKTAKAEAERSLAATSAEKFCREQCTKALADAVARADTEVVSARSALAGMTPPSGSAPLAERLGVLPWVWDLVVAAFKSFIVLGAALTVGLKMHPRQDHFIQSDKMVATAKTTEELAEDFAASLPPPPPVAQISDARPKVGSVARFLTESMSPAEGEKFAVSDLVQRYPAWCEQIEVTALDRPKLLSEIARLFDKADVRTEVRDGKVYCLDVRLAS